jgi:tryptophan synthase alpha chain
MSRLENVFAELRKRNQRAVMPFIAAGDPNLETTAKLIEVFHDSGCALCELGFPYSDPIADGPTIQAAFTRALNQGVKVDEIFRNLKPSFQALPSVAMLSYAIVHRKGTEAFVTTAADAGMAGLIVPDLPAEEARGLAAECQKRNLSLIQLVTPTTKPERMKRILELASGFVYFVSVAGVTGQRSTLPADLVDNLVRVRELTSLPVCVGFGVSEPEHVAQLGPHCDGVIVGSAIVRRIEEGIASGKKGDQIAEDVGRFCRQLVSAANQQPK